MSGRSRPTRRRRADLSQHFLRAARAARLVHATSITTADLVIEIGAGRGALTKPLSESAGRVCAVEVDAHLATRLAESLAARAEIVCEDFRTFALPSEPYKIVSDVPYGITTDIVKKLVAAPRPPSDAWLIVQRELAERLCGRPYTNETLWSLRLKPSWHVEIVERIKRTDFEPAPRVESVLMWLRHRGRSLLSAGERRIYLRMITTAYRDRAALKQVVQPWVSRRQLARLARDLRFAPTVTPSALLFEQWLGIVRFASRNSREMRDADRLRDGRNQRPRTRGGAGGCEVRRPAEEATMGAHTITGMVPVLPIGSYDEARAHYVDWLGFNLDWEWREAPGRPVIMAVSRGGLSLMLNEALPARGSWLTAAVSDVEAFAREWNDRRSGSAEIVVEPPYDIPTISTRDPFGNVIDFHQPVSAEEQAARDERAVAMRNYIRDRLESGHACPTPQEVVDAVGRPIGQAMDILCEFPEYAAADNP